MQCSASCGVGVQNREVYCRLKGSGRVRDDACDVGQRPSQARPCQRAECSPYTWEAGDWEEVSAATALSPLGSGSLSTTRMSRCLGHLVRGAFIGPALHSFVLCTIKQTTCRYPRSPASPTGGFVDSHRAGNHSKAQTTAGHHLTVVLLIITDLSEACFYLPPLHPTPPPPPTLPRFVFLLSPSCHVLEKFSMKEGHRVETKLCVCCRNACTALRRSVASSALWL